jgi:hypothetical protein
MSTEIAVRQDSTALLTLIERVSLNPEVDLAKLEKLVDLQERMLERVAAQEFYTALSEVAGELPSIPEHGKAMVGGQVRYTYALFEHIVEAIKPVLTRHGFALSFRTDTTKDVVVTGILSHRGGHREETTVTLPVDTSGSKNAVQAVQSAVSYGKRSTTGSLLNITSHGEDDDGFLAGSNFITPAQADEIEDLLARTGADVPAFFRFVGATSVNAIPAAKYQQAATLLRRKISSRPPVSSTPPEPAAGDPADGSATAATGTVSTPAGDGGGDGGNLSPPPSKISAAQHRRLEARITESGADREKLKTYFDLEHLTDMTRDQYEACDRMLDARDTTNALAKKSRVLDARAAAFNALAKKPRSPRAKPSGGPSAAEEMAEAPSGRTVGGVAIEAGFDMAHDEPAFKAAAAAWDAAPTGSLSASDSAAITQAHGRAMERQLGSHSEEL